jgi:hypothetical protein
MFCPKNFLTHFFFTWNRGAQVQSREHSTRQSAELVHNQSAQPTKKPPASKPITQTGRRQLGELAALAPPLTAKREVPAGRPGLSLPFSINIPPWLQAAAASACLHPIISTDGWRHTVRIRNKDGLGRWRPGPPAPLPILTFASSWEQWNPSASLLQ